MTNRKSHMGFRLTVWHRDRWPWMTLNCCKVKFYWIFAWFGDFGWHQLGTCEALWFDTISNRTSDSRFDSYWWSNSKFSNRPRCQSSFIKKRLVVVKFAFKVDFGNKISIQQHFWRVLWLNWNKQVLSSEFRSPYITVVRHKYKIPMD